ncbi:MAG: CHAT domain-containing protein, partial [Methylococcales bacterium]
SKRIQPKHILSALSKQQALVDFLIYKEVDFKTGHYKTEQIIAFVANPGTGVHFIQLGDLLPITHLIKTYRQAIEPNDNNDLWFSSKERQQSLIQTSQALYKKLWQPLSHALDDKKQVFIIPDGILHLLPFKALQNSQGQYLDQQIKLTRLGSARDIVFPKQSTHNKKAIILANPLFSANKDSVTKQNNIISRSLRSLNFAPLPGTQTESESIQTILQQLNYPVKLYTQGQASEATINKVTSPKILHLATHGFFLEKLKVAEGKTPARGIQWNKQGKLAIANIENPLARSGLAFSYANQGVKGEKQGDGTDGILTALEVLNLNLEGTELVTLSACETSVGEVSIGEGVYSLNRAFQEAGAKAVLSTLWSISDKATSLFMQKFYQRFLNEHSAQQALQQTQEEFKKSQQWNDPFFWAGFVVTGQDYSMKSLRH